MIGTITTEKPSLTSKRCYERSSQGTAFAVSFALSPLHRLIAPYAYLVRAEMLRPEEMVFYYSFGELRITGTKLEGLHDLVHTHELKSLWCVESPDDEIVGPRVERIAFESAEDDQED